MHIIEIWKDIKDFEGIYQVSNYGNVKSLLFGPKNVTCKYGEQMLHVVKSSTGYAHVQLYKNGKAYTINVHRLVAQAFVPNPDNKPEVNHIDANRDNNNASNLEWVTHSENIRHSMKIGNFDMKWIWHKRNYGKYTILQYSLDGEFVKEWNCINDIVDELGIKYKMINRCVNKHTRSSSGYMWIKRFDWQQIEQHIQVVDRCAVRKTRMPNKNRHKIAQYDKQNNLIHIWNSYHEIINHPSFGKTALCNIMKCATGNRKSAYGYIWKYM